MGPREWGNGFLALVNILSVQLRTILAAKGSIGSREMSSVSRAWALLVTPVVIVVCGGGETAIVTALGLYLLSHALHQSRKLRDVHSFSMGEPVLCRFIPNVTTARFCEGLLLVAGGLMLIPLDKGFGGWVAIGGVSHLFVVAWVTAKTQAQDMDVQDAQVEARARVERMGNNLPECRWR